jgi:hypothetical protein
VVVQLVLHRRAQGKHLEPPRPEAGNQEGHRGDRHRRCSWYYIGGRRESTRRTPGPEADSQGGHRGDRRRRLQ